MEVEVVPPESIERLLSLEVVLEVDDDEDGCCCCWLLDRCLLGEIDFFLSLSAERNDTTSSRCNPLNL